MKNEIDNKLIRLGPDSAIEILGLIINGYESRILTGSIYRSPKALTYIFDILCNDNHQFYGQYINGELACFMHVILLGNQLHLNHIMTMDSYKGRGLGSSMMRFLLTTANIEKKNISLDVDSESEFARNWYKSLDFIDAKCEKKQILENESQNCHLLKMVLLDDSISWSKYGAGFGQLHFNDSDLNIPVGVVSPNILNIDSSFLIEGLVDYILTQNKGCSIVARGSDDLSGSKFYKEEWITFRMIKNA